ncbi:DUF6660 family protein [Mucilaginibacter sp. SP1R1]|uniref:DUF6660 family protein n=1 Tax=Mucilaginibacter sp. SP1R1 TaxID=2723091 RepID=UPI00160BAD55|nr:DUF6660 family protein [Mucilaginibacter sp. SP1R1]MBB6148444.1 hypothetical protein [Mucilaginibacter sp. SP1R1]
MKFIALFLSIYMTALAFMPCRDKQDTAALNKIHTTVQKSHTGNDQCGQESCSPFCSCTCCSTVRTLQPQTLIQFPAIQLADSYTIHPTPAIQQVSLSVWQPPQLS